LRPLFYYYTNGVEESKVTQHSATPGLPLKTLDGLPPVLQQHFLSTMPGEIARKVTRASTQKTVLAHYPLSKAKKKPGKTGFLICSVA